ncbi:MAG: Mut7-C RNAse domain-containing protein [Candidatus Anstonellales archaeon]
MPKFLVDEMLGDVARWLRILGYDAAYVKKVKDEEIVRKALEEGRVILTRDEKMKSKEVRIYVVKGKNFYEKMADIVKHFRLSLKIRETRCALCNGELKKAKKEEVKHRVPRKVLEKIKEFWVCKRCGQVYWEGGHWKRIKNVIGKVKKLVERDFARLNQRTKLIRKKINSKRT